MKSKKPISSKSIQKQDKAKWFEILGNAETSERGKDEFFTDLGVQRTPDKPSKGHAPKPSERGTTEFQEDRKSL